MGKAVNGIKDCPCPLSSTKRGTISGDVMFHTVLIRVCRLEAWHEKLMKVVYYCIEGVNAGDVETTDGGAEACNTSHNHIEVVKTDETFVGHVNGQPIGSQEISTEDGVSDICHLKLLCEGVSLAKYKGCFTFAPCFDECAVGSD